MKILFKTILVFLIFTIDIRVKASSGVLNFREAAPTELPEGCIQNLEVQCAIKTSGGRKAKLEVEKGVVVLSSASSFLRINSRRGRILEGTLLIDTQEKYDLETPYGVISILAGSAIFQTAKARLVVKNLDAKMSLEALGWQNPLELSPVYEVELGPVNGEKKVQMGVPRPIQMKETFKQWAQTFYGTKLEFYEKAKSVFSLRSEVVDSASQSYEQEVERKLASAAEDQEIRRKRQIEILKEQKRLRDLFYRNTFE